MSLLFAVLVLIQFVSSLPVAQNQAGTEAAEADLTPAAQFHHHHHPHHHHGMNGIFHVDDPENKDVNVSQYDRQEDSEASDAMECIRATATDIPTTATDTQDSAAASTVVSWVNWIR